MSKRRIAHLPICNFQFGNEHDFIFKPQLCGRQAQGVVDHVCCYFASPRPSRPSRPSRPASTSPRPASTSFTSRVLHVPMSLTSPTSLTSTSPTSTSCEKRPCLFRSSFWGVILWDARQPITPIIAGIIANLGYTPLQIRILMNAHEIISGVFHLYTVNNQDPLLWKTGNKCLGSGFFSPHFAQKLFLYKIMGYTQACFSSQQQWTLAHHHLFCDTFSLYLLTIAGKGEHGKVFDAIDDLKLFLPWESQAKPSFAIGQVGGDINQFATSKKIPPGKSIWVRKSMFNI